MIFDRKMLLFWWCRDDTDTGDWTLREGVHTDNMMCTSAGTAWRLATSSTSSATESLADIESAVKEEETKEE